jgi:hypothetical protein
MGLSGLLLIAEQRVLTPVAAPARPASSITAAQRILQVCSVGSCGVRACGRTPGLPKAASTAACCLLRCVQLLAPQQAQRRAGVGKLSRAMPDAKGDPRCTLHRRTQL